ncbi:MAG TPA: hypothetical protein VMI75_01130 [Polyangiaceae bacterium]|nr:hypothetical protein [Polyangiaceae bacterium]
MKWRDPNVTERILAALDPRRAQTTREVARKARTTVAIAGAVLNRLRKQGLVLKQAPWLLVRRRAP